MGCICKVYDQQKRLVMKVKRSVNHLYKIILETSKGSCLMSNIDEVWWRWHS